MSHNQEHINIKHLLRGEQCFTLRKVNGKVEVACIVTDLDGPIHTDAKPFCQDSTCPCHHDTKYVYQHVGRLLVEGVMSEAEATRMFSGQLVGTGDENECAIDYPNVPPAAGK